MDDGVDALARVPERRSVAHIGLKQLQSRHRPQLATIVHGVVDHGVVTGIEELRDQEGAHIPSTTSDQNLLQAKGLPETGSVRSGGDGTALIWNGVAGGC